jgi:DNA polymerase V
MNKPLDEHRSKVMHVIDSLNNKMGPNTVFYGAQGIQRTWSMRQDLRSPRYTTKWAELPVMNLTE